MGTAGRRLNDRFAGGRLEGRLGFGNSESRSKPSEGSNIRSRLSDRLGSRRHQEVIDVDSEDRDSLERDMGDDLRGMELVNNMVIKVTRSADDRRDDLRDEMRRDRAEKPKQAVDREKEIRQRLKEIQREKEMIDVEKRRKQDSSSRVRRDRDHRRDREDDRSSLSFINQIKERAKKLDKYKSKKKAEHSSDESESES